MTHPTKSSIPRCAHHVYTIDTPNGKDNPACSICTPIAVGDCKTVLVKNEDGRWKNVRD